MADLYAKNASTSITNQANSAANGRLAKEWGELAEPLADWTLARVAVRNDVYGAYKPDGGQYTAHAALDRELLIRHFRGETVIGGHLLSTNNLCKLAAIDIDAHDDLADPDTNWRQALRAAEMFGALGFNALIFDSNGKGGYHVRVFFKKPVASKVAWWLVQRVVASMTAEGFPACEAFPKQAELTLDCPYGNWLRFPGRHHKRPFWSRIYDPERRNWLAGKSAAKQLLAVAGDKTGELLKAYQVEQDAQADAGPKTNDAPRREYRNTEEKPGADELRSALNCLPKDWADSYGGNRADTGWLGVGMALNDWDPSEGLALWHEWSSQSDRYDAAVLDDKWGTFNRGGGITVRTIFKEAWNRGWRGYKPPTSTSTSTNGNHASNGKPRIESAEEEDVEIVDRWPKINPIAFYGVAGEFVRAIDPHTESDPAAVLAQFMVVMGNIAGRNPYYPVGGDRHHLNEFVALVGRTATGRKGSSWGAVRYGANSADPEWCNTRITGGLVSGEGLIYHVRDATYKTVDIKERGRVVGQETVIDDPGESDKRLLVVETEMGRVLKAMNRETNTLSDVVRQAWDTGHLATMAKNAACRASNAHISLICHVTQADIQKHLLAEDSLNGFGNRFLWVAVRRSKILPDGGDLEGPAFQQAWEPIRDRLGQIREFAQNCGRMRRDREAAEIWRGVYEQLSAGKPGTLGALLSRAEAHVTRLSCMYAFLDLSATVRAEHMTAALALWDYAEASGRFIFGDRLADSDSEKLLSALRENPDGLTRTEISVKVFGGHKTKAQIASMLTELLTLGEIHRAPKAGSGPGRRAEVWRAGRGS